MIATNKLRKSGDGSTITSCYGCDPAQPVCSVGCQDLIDTVYYVCDGVTMPDGYYFDPTFQLTGSFIDNLDDMKINVERCGCNSASKGTAMSVLSMFLVLVVAIWMVLS